MKRGDLLRLTRLREVELDQPVWARVDEIYDRDIHASHGSMTLIVGPEIMHLRGACFRLPSKGWAIYMDGDMTFENSGRRVPDAFYADQAKWALL